MVSNKASGTAFEWELAGWLSGHGFWVHRLQDNKNGQPADLVAAMNGSTYLIDCKRCEGSTFQLSRIEPNQHTAMMLWHDTGNGWGLFAVMVGDRVYMVSYRTILGWMAEGWKKAPEDALKESGMELNHWIRMHTTEAERNGTDGDYHWG